MWRAALDLLYPARCAACDLVLDEPDESSVAAASLTLAPIISACPRCARPSPLRIEHPAPCLGCLERPPRFAAAAAGFEFGGALAEAIRRLKWGQMPELAPALGPLLYAAVARAPADFRDVDLIAPVPLHRRRLRAREFNQAAELAAALREAARTRDAPLGRVALDARALVRTRDTPPQTGLDALQRRHNVLGAFRARDPARVRGRRVLVVDDVHDHRRHRRRLRRRALSAGASAVLVLTLGRAMT